MRRAVVILAAFALACGQGAVESGNAAQADGCGKSAECPVGYFCVDSACQVVPPEVCASNRDCPGDLSCDRGSGQCVDGPPATDSGPPDAGRPDAGQPDAGTLDAGMPDAGTADAGTPDAGSAPDFTLSASPSAVTGSATSNVTSSGQNGFAGSIALSVSGAPSGGSASLSATSISAGGGATVSLTPGTAAAGTYSVQVKGTSGALSHTASIGWTIAAAVCTTDTWTNWARTLFVNNCSGCHGWASGYSGVSSRSGDCQSRIQSGNMPQGRALSASDKSRVLKWLSCGLPQ